jgi:peptidyl-prolyl cis-trans isomerase C
MSKNKIIGLLVVMLAVGLLYYRNKKSGEGTQVVAKVGSIKITVKDFEDELAGSPPAYQNYLSTLEGRKQFLDILLKEKLLMNAAEKSGVAKKQDVQKAFKQYKERMDDQEKEFRKNIILREYLRGLQDGELKVTEADIRKYYDEHKNEYQNPVRISASHILLPTEPEAKEALARLKKGEDFVKLAKEISKDPTAIRGGKIGEVMKGDLSELPEFEKELFSMRTGAISGIVKTKIGYHIIKKDSETRLSGNSFEDAAPQIRRILEKKKVDDWIEKSKKDQKLWIDDKVLASVAIPSASPSAAQEEPVVPENPTPKQ